MPHNSHCCITSPGVTSKSMSALLLLIAKQETRPWFSSSQYPKLLPWNSSLTHEIAKRRQLLRNWVIKLFQIYMRQKKETHLLEMFNSQEDHMSYASLVYISVNVCQVLLRHKASKLC